MACRGSGVRVSLAPFFEAQPLAGFFVSVIGGAILLGPIGALAGLVGGGIAGAESGDESEGYFVVNGHNKKGQKYLTLFTL